MDNRKSPDHPEAGRKTRKYLAVILITAGMVLLVFGLAFHSVTILPAESDGQETIQLSEPEIISDTTVGGVSRVGSGQIKRTYTGKAPSTCPT